MNVFTYGSLMFDDIWQEVTKEENSHQPATIVGFSRVYIKGDVYPVLKSASLSDSLAGILYTKVSEVALQKLDAFEGDYYQRKNVKVTLEKRSESIPDTIPEKIPEKIDAQVYQLKPAFQCLASNQIWEPDTFLAKHKDHFLEKYCTDP